MGTPLQNDVSIKFEQTVQSLICPAPPTTHTELSLDVIQNLTVPTPPTCKKGGKEGGKEGRKEGREGGREGR